jgi:hypothetical protein
MKLYWNHQYQEEMGILLTCSGQTFQHRVMTVDKLCRLCNMAISLQLMDWFQQWEPSIWKGNHVLIILFNCYDPEFLSCTCTENNILCIFSSSVTILVTRWVFVITFHPASVRDSPLSVNFYFKRHLLINH